MKGRQLLISLVFVIFTLTSILAFVPISPRFEKYAARSFNAQSRDFLKSRKKTHSELKIAAIEQIALEDTQNVASWRRNLDLAKWAAEVREIENEFRQGQGEEDVQHLEKISNISTLMYGFGLLLSGLCPLPNPVSALLLSTAICARWTMVGHHVSHGGYSSQVPMESRFHRTTFCRGPVRRVVDWLDWMLPEAWDHEHNYKHHYMLGEAGDPDLVERNAHSIRNSWLPQAAKYAQVLAFMTSWKWFYYAPNTLKELYEHRQSVAAVRGQPFEQPFDLPPAAGGQYGAATEQATARYCALAALRGDPRPALILAKALAPYFLVHFAAVPAAFGLLCGPDAAAAALANICLAEVLTNIHSFAIIAPNHAGPDLYRFETPVKPRSDEFYLRAVIGSANFRTGGDFNDFVHGWLNYQIEHHMFPDLSMLSYQRMAPRIRAVCLRHGVPYVQENVLLRLWKTVQVGVGAESMLVWERGD